MDGTKKILSEVYELIAGNNSNEAFRIYENAFGDMLQYYLSTLHWQKDEATEIVHDAFLLIEKKVHQGKTTKLTVSYLKKTCKLIGANKWRKKARDQKAFQNYFEETKRKVKQDYLDTYQIDIYENEENGDYRLALRAFDLLNDKCKKLVRLKFVDQMNHKDIISKMNGISNINSSKTILNRCMNAWRNFMDKIKNQK